MTDASYSISPRMLDSVREVFQHGEPVTVKAAWTRLHWRHARETVYVALQALVALDEAERLPTRPALYRRKNGG